MDRVVVAGIHTEIGKTVVAAILTEALKGWYWKPVQCGEPRDTDWVRKRVSLPERVYPERFCLSTPCSPHLAAKKESIRIEANLIVPPVCGGTLVIEGTGGIFAPLNERETWMDAAIAWDARWVLVHRHYLGSLNHFLLTVEAIHRRCISLAGVVFNGDGDLATEEMLLRRADTICLGRLTWQKRLTPKIVQALARKWTPLQGI